MLLGVDVKGEEKAIHNVEIKLLDKVFLAEHCYVAVYADDGLSKAVIVDTAHKVCQEVVSDILINAGEDELEKIKDTGAIVTPAKI